MSGNSHAHEPGNRKKRKLPLVAADGSGGNSTTTQDYLDEQFKCPITHGLPIDPVMAQDEHMYERAAILKWLKEKHTSPMTNEGMGVRLTSMPCVKRTIQGLVEQGSFSPELVADWTKRNRDRENELNAHKKVRERLIAAAATPGPTQQTHIISLALAREKGLHGFKQSMEEAMRELQRGAEKDLTTCMVFLGIFKLRSSVLKDIMTGMHWLTAAAFMNNASACMILGIAFADKSTLPACFTTSSFINPNIHNMAKNNAHAARWFKKALENRVDQTGGRIQDHHVQGIENWLAQNQADH